MLQQEKADDYVLGTGESHTVQEFLEYAFCYVNLDWHDYVEIDPRYLRPTEVDCLQADISKANKSLGWSPRVRFQDLVKIMVDADMKASGLKYPGEGEKFIRDAGFSWIRA